MAYLVFEDVPPWFDQAVLPDIPQDIYASSNPSRIARLTKTTLDEALTYSRNSHPSWDENAHLVRAESKLNFDPAWFRQSWQVQPAWKNLADKITYPSLLISGDNHLESLVSPKMAQRAQEAMSSLKWTHIPEPITYPL